MEEEEKGKDKFQFSTDFDRSELDETRTIEIDTKAVQKELEKDESEGGWLWKDEETPVEEKEEKPKAKRKKKEKPSEEAKEEKTTEEVKEEKPKRTRKTSTTKKTTTKKSTSTKKSTTKKTTTKKTTLREKKEHKLEEYEFLPEKDAPKETTPVEEEKVQEKTIRDDAIVLDEARLSENETPTEEKVVEQPKEEVKEEIKEEPPKVEDEIVEEVMAAMEKREIEDETAVLSRAELDAAMESPSFKKVYVNFQTRVILLVLGILVLFGSACFIIVSTLQSNEVRKVDYLENSTAHYDVCLSSNSLYETKCLKEGKTYDSSTASKIHVDFRYEALFDSNVRYKMSYYIVITNRIFDQNDKSKVSYEDEDIVVDKTEISGDNPAKVSSNVEVDYQKYNRFVQEYKRKYSPNVDATLDVSLFVDDGKQTRSVSKVQIPLGTDTFQVSRETIVDKKQTYVSDIGDWSNTNTLYIVIGSVFVLLSLFLLFHLTKLSLAVTGKKSKYQEELTNILNEYDRLIVIARDGYETNIAKRIVKVDSFDELLDAREVLEKPIIYSKINNVKSEFIVEDEFIIYKFILKEADVEKQ